MARVSLNLYFAYNIAARRASRRELKMEKIFPFAGMDPYLEAPDIWPDFHERVSVELSGTR